MAAGQAQAEGRTRIRNAEQQLHALSSLPIPFSAREKAGLFFFFIFPLQTVAQNSAVNVPSLTRLCSKAGEWESERGAGNPERRSREICASFVLTRARNELLGRVISFPGNDLGKQLQLGGIFLFFRDQQSPVGTHLEVSQTWPGEVGSAQGLSQSSVPASHKILLVSMGLVLFFEKPIPALLEGHQHSIISEVFSNLHSTKP